MTKRKQFWVIAKDDGTCWIARWVPLKGMVITDDPRTLDQAVSDAAAKGFEVNYCSIIYGMGHKTTEAVCKQIGHGWDMAARVTLYDGS